MESTSGPSNVPDEIELQSTAAGSSHSEAVQALRKYLLRKMSSEESSGDKELDCVIPTRVISVAETNGSKLYCSLVQRPITDDESPSSSRKCLAKHRSLDLDDSTIGSSGLRYLRTDLCIPVLFSKCSFCDDFFENDEQLRKHLRDSHFQYFSDYVQMKPLTSTKSLSDLQFSSALQIRDSPPLPNLGSLSAVFSENNLTFQGTNNSQLYGNRYGASKKSVFCEVCGKGFSTKWNCKQHLKCHARE